MCPVSVYFLRLSLFFAAFVQQRFGKHTVLNHICIFVYASVAVNAGASGVWWRTLIWNCAAQAAEVIQILHRPNQVKAASPRGTTVTQPLKMHSAAPRNDSQLETNGDTDDKADKDAGDLSHTATAPPGWIREVKRRKSGKTAGKLDVYFIRWLFAVCYLCCNASFLSWSLKILHIFCQVFKVISFCFSSPQGPRFRSKASLHAFLLENPDGNLHINLFDFTASKSDRAADVSSVKQTRTKRKPPGRPQEASTEIMDAPPSDRDSTTVGPAEPDEAPVGSCQMKTAPVKIQIVSEAESEPGQTSPQKAASLREKLLKLVPPASRQYTSPAAAAASQPPSEEPAAESENEGEDERGGEEEEEEEVQIRRGGDDGSKSDGDAAANGGCDVEEVLLPEVTAARESQNSKYEFHADNFTRSKLSTKVELFFPFFFKNY